MKKYLIFFTFILFLSGCSGNRPNDVRQEIWDEGIQHTIYLNKVLEEEGQIEEGYNDVFLSFVASYNETKLTKTEDVIIDNLRQLNLSFLTSQLFRVAGGDNEEKVKEFKKYYTKLEEVFGKSNLNGSKLDQDFIDSKIETQVVNSIVEEENKVEKYMSENGLKLTANEVRFNMPNNLDKPFFIDGEVELCDYYNYGFTNETAFFCGRLTPTDGSYSDSWYLYFHRESFKELYDYIIDGTTANIMVTAEIPSRAYKSGQGNMARVNEMKGK